MRALLACATFLALVTSVRADVATRVVVAETGAAAVLIWNASPVVAQIARDRVSESVANDRLERGALRAIATSLKLLPRAKSVTVRILYDATGDVSPVYGGALFAGVVRYATMTLDAPRARASASRWKGLRDTDPLPAWVGYRVIGKLPPQ